MVEFYFAVVKVDSHRLNTLFFIFNFKRKQKQTKNTFQFCFIQFLINSLAALFVLKQTKVTYNLAALTLLIYAKLIRLILFNNIFIAVWKVK